MSSVQADELNIKINLDVQSDATKRIGKIVSGIKTLKSTVGGADKLDSFATSINTLSKSFESLKDSKGAIATMEQSLSGLLGYLEKFDPAKYMSGLSGLNAVFDKLGKSMETFVRRAAGLQEAANGAMYIQNAAMSLNGISVPDDAKANLDKIADAIKRVSQYGTAFNNLTAGLKRLPEAVAGMNTSIDDKSFNTLNQTVARLNTALAGLNRESANAFTHVAQGIETLNKAGVNPDLANNMQAAADACNKFITAFGNGVSDEALERFYRLSDALQKVTEGYKSLNAAQRAANGGMRSMGGDSGIFGSITALIGKIPGGGNFATLTGEIGKLGGAVEGAASGAAAAFGVAAAAIGALVAAYKILKAWITDVNKVFAEHVEFLKKIGEAAIQLGSTLGSGAVEAFKKAGQAGKAFVSGIYGIAEAVGSLKDRMDDSFGSISKTVKGMAKALTKTLRMIFNTLTRMTIRKVLNAMFSQLKEALDRLVNYSRYAGTQFAKSMDMFATSSRYFGNSFMAMVSPIINAVMPVLDRLVDSLVNVMNHINEFISFMSGASTWTSAIKVPIKYATAAEKAAEKQKKLNNTILAFDELNRLNGDNKDDSSMEGVYEFKENPFGDWLTSIKDLDSLFGRLAASLKGFTANLKEMLASINWDSVYATAERLGQGIMSLFNILFGDPSLAKILGETFGKTINTAFHFAHGLIEEWAAADWAVSFTRFITSALESLDWGLIQGTITRLGERLAQYFNVIFDAKVMFKDVGTALSEGINAIIYGVQAFIEDFDFHDMGVSLGLLFENLFKGIDYDALFTTVAEGINGVFDSLAGWFETVDLSGIAESILTGLDNGLQKLDWEKINSSMRKIGTSLVNALNTVFGDTQFWADLGDTIGNGINAAIQLGRVLVENFNWDDFGESVGTALGDMLKKIDWLRLGSMTGELITGMFEAAGEFFKSLDGAKIAENMTAGLKKFLDSLDWDTIGESVKSIASSLGDMFNVWLSDKELWGKVGETLANALSTAIQGLATFLSELDPVETADSIITFFTNAIDKFIGDEKNVEALNNIISWAVSLVESLIEGWDTSGMYDKIKGFLEKINWDSLFGAVSKLMVTIALTKMRIEFDMFALKARVWVEEKFELLKGIVETFGDTILGVVSFILNPIASVIGSFLGDVIANIVIHFTQIKGTVETKLGEISTRVKAVWTTLKDNVTTIARALWTNITGVFDNIKNAISDKITQAKGIAETKFGEIKSRIISIVSSVREEVTRIVDRIKDAFNFEWKLPHLKLPHLVIDGWHDFFGASVPDFHVDWYKKAMNQGMILNGATIFGVNNNGGLMGGGEAGSEAVVGTDALSRMIQESVNSAMGTQNLASTVAGAVVNALAMADNSPTVDLTLNVDSETLYRMVRKGENSYNGRYRIIEGVT